MVIGTNLVSKNSYEKKERSKVMKKMFALILGLVMLPMVPQAYADNFCL